MSENHKRKNYLLKAWYIWKNEKDSRTGAFNGIQSFIYITLNENHIAKPAVLVGHFVWWRTQLNGVANDEFLKLNA